MVLKLHPLFIPPDWSVAAPVFGAGLLLCILNSWAWNTYVSDLIAFAAARNPMPYFLNVLSNGCSGPSWNAHASLRGRRRIAKPVPDLHPK